MLCQRAADCSASSATSVASSRLVGVRGRQRRSSCKSWEVGGRLVLFPSPLAFTSDATGYNVKGAFTLAASDGRITVQATCLEVSRGIGGLVAGTGGKVIASTAPDVFVGDGVLVGAFDTATSTAPDVIANVVPIGGDIPGANQCQFQQRIADVTHGNVIISQGS